MSYSVEQRKDARGRRCWVVLDPCGNVVNGVQHRVYSDADHQRKVLDAMRPWITSGKR